MIFELIAAVVRTCRPLVTAQASLPEYLHNSQHPTLLQVFAVVLGTVGTQLVSSKLLHDRVDRQLAELREFLYEKRVEPELRKKIRTHMEHLYRCAAP